MNAHDANMLAAYIVTVVAPLALLALYSVNGYLARCRKARADGLRYERREARRAARMGAR